VTFQALQKRRGFHRLHGFSKKIIRAICGTNAPFVVFLASKYFVPKTGHPGNASETPNAAYFLKPDAEYADLTEYTDKNKLRNI
jgi:hypothetical protein